MYGGVKGGTEPRGTGTRSAAVLWCFPLCPSFFKSDFRGRRWWKPLGELQAGTTYYVVKSSDVNRPGIFRSWPKANHWRITLINSTRGKVEYKKRKNLKWDIPSDFPMKRHWTWKRMSKTVLQKPMSNAQWSYHRENKQRLQELILHSKIFLLQPTMIVGYLKVMKEKRCCKMTKENENKSV